MTAEQLEKIAKGVNPSYVLQDMDWGEVITALSRRVIAAEKLVEALDKVLCHEDDNWVAMRRAVTAYREASK